MLQFRGNCFPKTLLDLSCSLAMYFSAVISCVKSDEMRKKQKDVNRDRGCIAGFPGNFPAFLSPHQCFPTKSRFYVGSQPLTF